jgi:hypothetical protein
MNVCRWAVVGLLLFVLASCGAFLAPPRGRWNLLDPTKDASTTLSVVDDGWVDTGGAYTSSGTVFNVCDSYRGLLRFPFKQVEVDLAHAELEIYFDSGVSPAVEIGVRAIIKDPPASGNWAFIIGGYTSVIGSPGIQVYLPGLYRLDVTSLFTSLGPSAIKGLLVENRTAGVPTLSFRASEYGGSYPPKLLLWYPKW